MAQSSLFDNVQGQRAGPGLPETFLPNTSWTCDKVLYLDANYTNMNFIGEMANLSVLLVLILIIAPQDLNAIWSNALPWLCRRLDSRVFFLATPISVPFPMSYRYVAFLPRQLLNFVSSRIWPSQHPSPDPGILLDDERFAGDYAPLGMP